MIDFNVFFWLILVALLADYLLNLVSDFLNLKALSRPVPPSLAGLYDEDQYRKSQAYQAESIRFGFLSGTVSLAATLLFWLAGGFPWMWSLAGNISVNPIWQGLIFTAGLMALKSLLSTPFSVYATFSIEARYGFNKTTWKTWISDRLKGLALGILIGGPILAGLIFFFTWAGSWGWLYAFGTIILVTLIIQYVAPVWIMPLFNKFQPLENGSLRESIMALAGKVEFPLKDIYVIDGSRRSTKGNAYFTGFGKNKRIALYDTLIQHQDEKEILAVVAHEIGHYKLRHIPLNMVIGFLHTGVLMALLSVALSAPGLFAAFGMTTLSVAAGLIFFGMLFTPVELILGIAMSVLSRKHEFEADAYAIRVTGLREELASALKKLSRQNLSNLTPHPFTVFVEYSHPPLAARLDRMAPAEPIHP